MREKYTKPVAEEVLFDINDVNMEITLASLNDGNDSLIESLENGTGLLSE